jgi:hypothetical protein
MYGPVLVYRPGRIYPFGTDRSEPPVSICFRLKKVCLAF